MGATFAGTESGDGRDRAGIRHSRRAFGRRAHGDRGTAVIELALLLPFLAILVFGTVDLGRAYQLKNRLTNAAREGAFYGQFHPCDTAGIDTAVSNEDPGLASLPGFTSSSTVSGCPTSASGDLKVTASAQLTILTPFVGAITGQKVTVGGNATVVVQ